MFVAQELRKKSIAEYLLYMWQIEDIIRAYGCSLPVIKKNYVDRFDFTPEQREEELDWFGNLIRMTAKIANHTITILLAMLLDSMTDITYKRVRLGNLLPLTLIRQRGNI